jgi:hypothetical protein
VIRVDSNTAGSGVALTLRDSSFQANHLTLVSGALGTGAAIGMFASNGAAISLDVSLCEFANNSLATLADGARGGAIFFNSGGVDDLSSVVISNSSFTQNRLDPVGCGTGCTTVQGGALWVQCSTGGTACLDVARSKFVDNYVLLGRWRGCFCV